MVLGCKVRLDDVCRCESGLPMRARAGRPPQCGGRGAGVRPGADAYFGEVRQHEQTSPGQYSGCSGQRDRLPRAARHRRTLQSRAWPPLRRGPACSSRYRPSRRGQRPTVIRTLAALRDCELVIVRDNVQPNGARLSNSYELTALGLEVMRMAEELGTFAE